MWGLIDWLKATLEVPRYMWLTAWVFAIWGIVEFVFFINKLDKMFGEEDENSFDIDS